jgi:hypothetical protein
MLSFSFREYVMLESRVAQIKKKKLGGTSKFWAPEG